MKHAVLGLGVSASLLAATLAGVAFASSRATTQDAARGGAIFNNNCAVCHGTMASGRMGPPLNMIPPEIKSLPPEAIAGQLTGLIRNGIPGRMPRFLPAQIADSDVPDLVAYLFSVESSVPSPQIYESLAPASADAPDRTFYPETGHSVGGEFRTFFMQWGGPATLGLPITEEYWGVSAQTGEVLRMQLFERVRLELHTDAAPAQRVQLGMMGTEELDLRTHFGDEGGM